MDKSTFGFFFDEERSNPVSYHLKIQAEVLTDQFIVLRDFISNRPEWTAAGHLEASLQLDLGAEPRFQVLPRFDLIVKGSSAFSDRFEVVLQDLVYQALLVLEIVVELPLAGPGGLHDPIRA